MEKLKIDGFDVVVRRCETLIVGAGAAAMNCAVHLAEFNRTNGKADFAAGVKIITGGIPLGTSRMSGSDKQTYYKLGTSAETADSAMSMAKSLTAAGCCHEDLALIESITSLREFFHLVRSGV
ncbi:MAG TPA: oxidoreductase, partial [Phycisphaerae bacterium]|nr:oxidoreductase [Phycisphaerae bacterium]